MITSIESGVEWWDWSLSNALSLGQLVFTFAGFSIAIVQIWRTADATVASRLLLDRMRVRLLGNDVMVVLPELHVLEDRLDSAIKSGESDDVETVLISYARRAAHVAGLLESEESLAKEPLVDLLKQASSAASKAKAELAQGPDRELRLVVKLTLKKIAGVSIEASALGSRLQKKVGSP